MRLLAIHSDFMEYEVTKKTPLAEKVEEELKKGRMEETLVCFLCVEEIDEGNENVVEDTVKEIIQISEQVKTQNIMLYPYAHLSSSLASPKKAVEILKGIERELKSLKYNVKRSPFGYYKAFKISCKGHPLSELSRSILPREEMKEEVSEALKAEEKLKSYWYILTPQDELTDVLKFDYSKNENLRKFVEYETSKVRGVDVVPPHVELMQKLEYVGYEKGSDAGNFRWYPKGTLIKRLLEEKITQTLKAYGAMEVETPIMYDLDHPRLSKYLNRFPARQYIIKSGDKNYFLRFAACFGQYLMKHDMVISHKNLPLRIYELTHFSFRREQRGELVGLRRLRAFTMPDMHTLVPDIEQAKQEFFEQFKLSMEWMQALDLDYEVGIRFVRSFFEENREFASELSKLVQKPILLEIWDERPFYFVMKFEFNFVDSLRKASALSTVQIDIENTKRFEISYIDERGEKRYPLMLHASISGSIDRAVYALLEKAYLDMQKGLKPCLPLWLCPTQMRFIPVSDEFLGLCEEFSRDFRKFRVDIDDRAETVPKRVRDAEKEWIPYIVVVGERERALKKLSVRVRGDGTKEMSATELLRELEEKTRRMPKRPLPLDRYLSKRPKFR